MLDCIRPFLDSPLTSGNLALYPLLAQAGFQFFATEEFGDFVSDFDSLAVGSKDLREREGGGEGEGEGVGGGK